MSQYRTTRRHFTDQERERIIARTPEFHRSVTVLWDHDDAGAPDATCVIRAHESEFGAVLKAIREVS